MYVRGHDKRGLTLIETTLVVATIALMVGFGIPAVRSLIRSFQTEGGTRSMIEAALSSARTMAMSRQRYVGIRFQKRCVSDDPANPLKGLVNAPQYMIFIVHDPPPRGTGLANGFRAMEGVEPMKLPETIGVLPYQNDVLPDLVTNKQDRVLNNATTFSIVFSPSGRLVSHKVRVRNRDGEYMPNNADTTKVSHDEVFNSVDNIIAFKEGMFIQDDYATNSSDDPGQYCGTDLGLAQESSVTGFVLYDATTFRVMYETPGASPGLVSYLTQLAAKPICVNSYSGQLIQ